MSPYPLVSVVVPCRNEERHIAQCLDSILACDFPQERLEILVVDGCSDDGTRAILARYAERYARIHVLDNPKRITPTALNIGVLAARGEIIMRMDAHVIYPASYISQLVGALEETGADNVGGIIATLPGDDSATARAIAVGLSHPLGVGNSYFRVGSRERRWTDAVSFGCYRRQVFERIGLFDEELVRNQDDEFDLRLIKHGGRVLLLPEVVSQYYARRSLRQVARMFYQYGYFKPPARSWSVSPEPRGVGAHCALVAAGGAGRGRHTRALRGAGAGLRAGVHARPRRRARRSPGHRVPRAARQLRRRFPERGGRPRLRVAPQPAGRRRHLPVALAEEAAGWPRAHPRSRASATTK